MPQQVEKNLSKAIKSINDHIDQLAATIPQVCLEDLTGLGQIHEHLAHLGQDCTGLDDQDLCKALLSLTEELTDQVEKLIIGSCPTPRPTFQQVIKTIT